MSDSFPFLSLWLCWVFIPCTWTFSSCGKQGLLFVVVLGVLIVVTSVAQRLWHTGLVPPCHVGLPNQALNPHPLHWQADS